MEAVIPFFVNTVANSQYLAEIILTLLSIIILNIIYVSVMLKNTNKHFEEVFDRLSTMEDDANDAKEKRAINTTSLALHSRESSINTESISKIKDDVSEMKGVLNIFGISRNRGVQ